MNEISTPTPAFFYAIGECSLGYIGLTRNAIGIRSITLADNDSQLWEAIDKPSNTGPDLFSQELLASVIRFIEKPTKQPELPLDIQGSAFQKRVWEALLKIPVGETRSYSDIAHQIWAPSSARAVAQACGANPIAVLIPCHRVVRSDGDLAGYRWDVARKAELLRREAGQLEFSIS